MTNSTFSGNAAGSDGGGIFNAGSGPTLNNSIVAGNTANGSLGSDDCDGCGTQSSNNLIGGTPQLAPLGWYGGPTQTMLPLPGSSQVIGKGTATATDSPDQRGFARPTTGSVDLGAVQTNYLIVITTADTSDATPGCDAKGDSPCSLRDALTAANSAGSADIAFASGVTSVINLSSTLGALPTIGANLDLFGPGANVLTVSGGNSPALGSIFTVTSTNAAISGITIANGNSGATYGGGINNNNISGILTVTNCTISGDMAGGYGGGIANETGTLIVSSSTFSGGNTATYGGGIYNEATLVVTNSTFSGNTALYGAGIYNENGALTVNNSTFSGNTATLLGGGIQTTGTPLTLSNSIVAGNTTTVLTGDDCDDCGAQSSSNLINTRSDSPPINPLLATLGWYGGPTQTMLPLPGSPAICAGSAALDPAGLLYDQRAFPRLNTTYTGYSTSTPCLDMGAVQTNYSSIQFAQSAYSGTPGADISNPAAPVVSVTENGQNIGAVPVTLSFSGTAPTSVTGNGPVTTVAGTGATFSSLQVSPGGDYTLEASLAITSSVTISNTAALDIDTPATVTSLTSTSPNGTYTTTAPIYITVNFSKAVTVTGTPQLALNSGGTASYYSGSPSNALVFKYTVGSGDSSPALDASSTTALTLNGGSISDSSSVPATLTLPAPGAAGSLSAYTTIVINTTQYTLTLVASPSADGTVQANPTSTPNVTPNLSAGTYLSGTQVTLTPTPSSNLYKFSKWTGTTNNNSTSNPLIITMNGSYSETANFVLNTVKVTIATSPTGLSFTVDGTNYTSTQVLTWQVGTKHTIATTTPQRVTGISYEDPTWSDGGAISHTVTAPTSATASYTATFEIFYQLTTADSPAAGGTVTPSLGGFYQAGSMVSIQAFPKSGYTFKSWTGNVAKSTSASTTITMTAPETVTANFAKK